MLSIISTRREDLTIIIRVSKREDRTTKQEAIYKMAILIFKVILS
jgi:hypothetical protein